MTKLEINQILANSKIYSSHEITIEEYEQLQNDTMKKDWCSKRKEYVATNDGYKEKELCEQVDNNGLTPDDVTHALLIKNVKPIKNMMMFFTILTAINLAATLFFIITLASALN